MWVVVTDSLSWRRSYYCFPFKMRSKENEWLLCMTGMTLVQPSSVLMATTVRNNTIANIMVLKKMITRGRGETWTQWLDRNHTGVTTVRIGFPGAALYRVTSSSTFMEEPHQFDYCQKRFFRSNTTVTHPHPHWGGTTPVCWMKINLILFLIVKYYILY